MSSIRLNILMKFFGQMVCVTLETCFHDVSTQRAFSCSISNENNHYNDYLLNDKYTIKTM